MEGDNVMLNMVKKIGFYLKKVQVKRFFDNRAMIKLTKVTNSSMLGYVGAEVKLRWLDRGILVSIIQENVNKCEQKIVIPRILDIKNGPDYVVFHTSNSTYEFHKCR